MPFYIAFQTGYLDRIVSEDGKKCTLDDVYDDYRVVLIKQGWAKDDYLLFPNSDDEDLDGEVTEDIPSGSIVFERTDGEVIGFKALNLYNFLVNAGYCCIYGLGDIKEFENVVVVECCSESG